MCIYCIYKRIWKVWQALHTACKHHIHKIDSIMQILVQVFLFLKLITVNIAKITKEDLFQGGEIDWHMPKVMLMDMYSPNHACTTHKLPESPHKSRDCHGWSRCNEIQFSTYCTRTCMSDFWARQMPDIYISLHQKHKLWHAWFLCRDSDYFWDSVHLHPPL